MKWLRKHYWLVYALGFIGLACLVFQDFFWESKGFVWEKDGQKQHIVALIYYAGWLRQVLESFFYEHRLVLPMWDLSIGQGSDILTTLSYYVIGDPLNLLSVFVDEENIETLYSGLILLRMFLAGISFSVYCFYHKHGKKAVLMGSYMYCFSAFVLYNGVRHPYFVNPMIYLPLMLMGIDKIFKKEKPYVFVIATAIAAASNFYFFYMLVIICVLYVLVTYKKWVGRWQWREMGMWFVRFAGLGLLAIMLASVIFLPSAMAVLSTGRMRVENYAPLLFDLKYYIELPIAFMDQTAVAYANRPGVAAPAMITLFLLFVRKKNRELKNAFVIMLLVFCIPYAGILMNGFSYVSYRCSFVSAFLMAYIFVVMFPEIPELSGEEKKKLLWVAGSYMVLVLVVAGISASLKLKSDRSAQIVLMGVIMLLCLACVYFVAGRQGRFFMTEILFGTAMVVSIGLAAHYLYSPEQEEYVSEFIDRNSAVERVSNLYDSNKECEFYNPSDILRKVRRDAEPVRMEMYGCRDASQNTAMIQNFYGTSYYFSVSNPYISRFHEEMGLLMKTEFNYSQLDCRSYLDMVNNVKYYITRPDGERDFSSALFQDEPMVEQNGYCLYGTEHNLGFAYGYDSWFPREDYDKMNSVERQEMLLQGAMLEERDTPLEMKRTRYKFHNVQKQYVVKPGENVKIEDGKIYVSKKGATVTLCFEGEKNSETYVLMEKLGFNAGNEQKRRRKKRLKKKIKDASWDKRVLLCLSYVYNKEPNEAYIEVGADTGKGGGSLNLKGKKNSFYRGEVDYMWNLGYSSRPVNSATITFSEKGEYTMADLSVYCQPMEQQEKAAAMKVDGGDSFTVDVNSFSGRVNLKKQQLLCFSVPYSKGWKIYVDGKEQQVLQTNTMFMSVLVEKGMHDIELKYRTPYIVEGALVELLGVIILLGMIVRDVRLKPKR